MSPSARLLLTVFYNRRRGGSEGAQDAYFEVRIFSAVPLSGFVQLLLISVGLLMVL